MNRHEWRPGEVVVTPTRRLAHYLRSRHDAACAARGMAVWPTPEILTWSGLVQRAFELDRQAGRLARRWLPDTGARLAWERLARHDSGVGPVIAPENLGRTAYRSWQLLHDYAIPRAALTDGFSPEAATFRRWVADYTDWLDALGFIDPAQAPWHVAPASVGPRLRLTGFERLTPAQEDYVRRARGAGVEVEIDAITDEPGRPRWVSVADRGVEIDTAARWAAQRLHDAPTLQLAIVVPQLAQRRTQVRRILDRVLAPQATLGGGPAPESAAYELAAARPLGERPVVAAAVEWLGAFCGPVDVTNGGLLVRSRFCAGADVEATVRARLDVWLRRNVRGELGLAQLAAHATQHRCPMLAELLNAALGVARTTPRRALPSAWSQEFFALLRALGWPGDGLDSDEQQARMRWQALLAELGAHDDMTGAITAVAALGVLRNLVDGTLFEPLEVRAPLLVIDPDTCAGMRFDALWICGLDSTQWPAPASPDPFLPRDWQARSGVPGATPESSADAARRTFRRLCVSADEVIVSVPQYEDEAPLLPSALLADVASAPLPGLWPGVAVARAWFAARPSPLLMIDGALPPIRDAADASGGARILELQAACPFRAGAELRLGARSLDEPSLGLDAAARGKLVHDVFARLWADVRDSAKMAAMPEGERTARLRAAIADGLASYRREAGEVLGKLLDIEAQWLEERGRELLAADLERPPFTVVAIEDDRDVALGGLQLRLRLDRVDRLTSGALAIIDYKTGANADPKSWLDDRPKLPQLPLYVEALGAAKVGAVAFGRVRAGATQFAGYARDPDQFPRLDGPPRSLGTWSDLLAHWHLRLTLLATEHATGDARLAPDPRSACRNCHLPGLCRIGSTALVGELDGDADG